MSRKINIFLNSEMVERLVTFNNSHLYEVFGLSKNKHIVNSFFNILSMGSVGDLAIEPGKRNGRDVLFCKLDVEHGVPWEFSLNAKDLLEKHNCYHEFKEYVKEFIEMSVFQHLEEQYRTCLFFTYELVPNEAIILIE